LFKKTLSMEKYQNILFLVFIIRINLTEFSLKASH